MTGIVYAPLPRRRRDEPKRITLASTIVRAKRARSIEAELAEDQTVEDVFKVLVAALRPPQNEE